MKQIIIACKTLENELNMAIDATNCTYDVAWFPAGLHNTPTKLTEALQELIDQATDYDVALFAMGFCGNSVAGLHSRHLTLVIPRVDDCISLVLGARATRANLPDGHSTYFFTEGWIQGERNLWVEYQYTIERYGKKRGESIFQMMLANYKNLALIDTHCYELEPVEEQVKHMASTMGLAYKKLEGTTSYLEALLQSSWNSEQFLQIPPNSTIETLQLQDLY